MKVLVWIRLVASFWMVLKVFVEGFGLWLWLDSLKAWEVGMTRSGATGFLLSHLLVLVNPSSLEGTQSIRMYIFASW